MNQPDQFIMTQTARQHYLEVLESQRQFLAWLNKKDGLDEALIRDHIYQIDLEEERIKMM